jgi:hypothetical protein
MKNLSLMNVLRTFSRWKDDDLVLQEKWLTTWDASFRWLVGKLHSTPNTIHMYLMPQKVFGERGFAWENDTLKTLIKYMHTSKINFDERNSLVHKTSVYHKSRQPWSCLWNKITCSWLFLMFGQRGKFAHFFTNISCLIWYENCCDLVRYYQGKSASLSLYIVHLEK